MYYNLDRYTRLFLYFKRTLICVFNVNTFVLNHRFLDWYVLVTYFLKSMKYMEDLFCPVIFLVKPIKKKKTTETITFNSNIYLYNQLFTSIIDTHTTMTDKDRKLPYWFLTDGMISWDAYNDDWPYCTCITLVDGYMRGYCCHNWILRNEKYETCLEIFQDDTIDVFHWGGVLKTSFFQLGEYQFLICFNYLKKTHSDKIQSPTR